MRIAPALLISLLFCACGSDNGSSADGSVASDADNPTPDGPTIEDAGPPVDADPGPDAPATVTACAGDELPSTIAKPPISISGIIRKGSTSGLSALGNGESVDLNAHFVADDEIMVGATFTGADETFTLTDPNSQTDPLDAYLHAVGEGFMDTYVYPPAPLTENQDNAPVIMVEDGIYGLLFFITGITQSANNGVLIVAAVDCDGAPVEGATVSISPNVGEIRYAGESGIPGLTEFPNTQSRGIAYIFNVPPGEYTIGTSIGGVDFRDNVVKSYAGANTSLITAP